jgi:multimeric flavodoxin WrbA
MKQVIALNGSPRANGRTAELIEATAQALKAHDVAVEVVHLRKADLRVCTGCNSCVLHDQRCILKDDMADLVSRLQQADGVILASPVYMWHISSTMKIFIDRMVSYFHRPDDTLVGKPVLSLATAAAPMGGFSTRYLRKIGEKLGMWGAGSITQMASQPKPVSERQVRRFVKELGRDRTQRTPSLGMLFNFWLQKSSALNYLPEDAAYFTARGWHKGYYFHKARHNPLYIAVIAVLNGLMSLLGGLVMPKEGPQDS